MLIYLVAAAATILLIILLIWFTRSARQRRVYDGFDELIDALSAEGHEGLFAIAEDEVIPLSYQEVDH